MNKQAINKFAVWARNKLINDITYRVALLGITEKGIDSALPQSVTGTEYYDIGTKEPYAISGKEIQQRQNLVAVIGERKRGSDYKTAFTSIIEETAYTWFNRLIAVRFMEVNDYIPSGIRVLSSLSGRMEPDIVSTPFNAKLDYTEEEKRLIADMKNEEKADELFRFLFLKQCNALNEVLPVLFEKVSDYTELLFSISFTDKEGIVYKLIHDIPEDDFNVSVGGQVEIIGWMYQYYNTEPKAKVNARPSGTKVSKEELPAVTQLFTPDWIVRYMVENSLGRLWIEGHPNNILESGWKYYLKEAEQEDSVKEELKAIWQSYSTLLPKDLTCIDPCSGSGHILCYLFDVLMQIYKSQGYTEGDAACSILENNIYGLDIDERAYQLSYFAIMMKARQYDKRILSRGIRPHVYAVTESNELNRDVLKYFGAKLDVLQKNNALAQINGLCDALWDAKEYGSILTIENYDWDLLRDFISEFSVSGQLDIEQIQINETQFLLSKLICVGEILAKKYYVVVTNPPYLHNDSFSVKLKKRVNDDFYNCRGDLFAVFIERCNQMIVDSGYNSMVTMQSWMFLSSFKEMRTDILNTKTVTNLMHMDNNVMGIAFGTVVSILHGYHVSNYKGTYFYVRLQDIINNCPKEFPIKENRFAQISADKFSKIPSSPIAYWIDENILNDYRIGVPITKYIDTFQGIITGNNDRFLRMWYELDISHIAFDYNKIDDIDLSKKYWIPYNKGGDFRKWYGNQDYVVYWGNGPDDKTRGKKSFEEYYLREYVSWSYITSSTLATRFFPNGFLWDVAGSGIFDKSNMLYYLQCLIGSKVGIELLNIINPTINFQVENIAQLPVIINEKEQIDRLAKENISISKDDWDSFEISWNFSSHPLKPQHLTSNVFVKEMFDKWDTECQSRFNTVWDNEIAINKIFIDTYKMDSVIDANIAEGDITIRCANLTRDIKSLLSYAVGCIFGRYSLDVDGIVYAGGEWDTSKYILYQPDSNGIIPITDDEYLEDDILGYLCQWLKVVYGENTLEENLKFIADALGGTGSTSREIIRNYFLKDFFKDHWKIYQKRPIYWLFDSGKENGFKALIYMHRYDTDTIGRVRVNYLYRIEKIYDNEIARLSELEKINPNSHDSIANTRRMEKLQRQLKECKDYDAKIAPLALARIEINLDDGVSKNYRKVQTDGNGVFHEILADSKDIMSKEK